MLNRLHSWLAGLALVVGLASGARAQTSAPSGTPGPDSIRVLVARGRYAEAEAAARLGLSWFSPGQRGDSLVAAEYLDLLSEALWRRGGVLPADADSLSSAAVNFRLRLRSTDHLEVAGSLTNRGRVLRSLGQLDSAVVVLERSLTMREKLVGSSDPEAAVSLTALGVIRRLQGDYEGALAYHERALGIRRARLAPDHPDIARSLANISVSLNGLARYSEALRRVEEAVRIFDSQPRIDSLALAAALTNQGSTLLYMRAWREALTCSGRAVATHERLFGAGSAQNANPYENLAIALSYVGVRDSSRRMFARAIGALRKAPRPRDEDIARVTLNWGKMERDGGNRDSGLVLIQQARQLFERSPASGAQLASALIDEGLTYYALNDLEQSEHAFERALEVHVANLPPEHPNSFAVHHNLAILHFLAGDKSQALELELNAETAEIGHLRLAFENLTEEEALRYLGVRTPTLPISLSIATATTDSAQLARIWEATMQTRGIVLDEMAARRRLSSLARDSTLQSLRVRRAAASTALASLVGVGPGGRTRAAYDDLVLGARARKADVERELAIRSSLFRDLLERRAVGFADVAGHLQQGQALVAYVSFALWDVPRVRESMRRAVATRRDARGLGDSSATRVYAAFVLRGGETAPRFVMLGGADTIDALVSRWREVIASDLAGENPISESAQRRVGIALRRRVWDPISPSFAGERLILVVPEGALNLVNLSALPSDGGRYLVETGPIIHCLTAEREIIQAPRERAGGQGLLAFGAVDYERSPSTTATLSSSVGPESEPAEAYRGVLSDCMDSIEQRFRPLAATGDEVRTLRTLWAGLRGPEGNAALCLFGSDAGEAAFKGLAPKHRVVHVATHGFFIGRDCGAQASKRREFGQELSAAGEPLDEDPLLRAGLIFAGANRRSLRAPGDEDGVLTAEEIATLDLSGVEWVVLSACNTGVGSVTQGEGVFGLRRAFALAGARTTIMSLWRVDDLATRRWMQRLYEARLRDGLGAAEAVRRAAKSVLEERRAMGRGTRPATWGAFIATGDWR